MDEMGERQLRRPHPASYGFPAFQEQDGFKGSAKGDGRGKSVRPGAHHNGIVIVALRDQRWDTLMPVFLSSKQPFQDEKRHIQRRADCRAVPEIFELAPLNAGVHELVLLFNFPPDP